jgi:bifunctional DNase/RNase
MPTATDRDFLDMQVSDVRRMVNSGRDCHVVMLQEVDGDRRLPIWIGSEAAMTIAFHLLGYGSQLARPHTSALAVHLVQALGGSLREVRIDRLVETTFYAVVVVDGPQGSIEVDARPSDALMLALVAGAPVRADRAVVETTESSNEVAEAFAALGNQRAAGAQALLDELAQEAERQDPPEPTSS